MQAFRVGGLDGAGSLGGEYYWHELASYISVGRGQLHFQGQKLLRTAIDRRFAITA